MPKGFYIWFVTYGPVGAPDVPPKLVAGPMTLAKALEEVRKLGFGYCVKEQV